MKNHTVFRQSLAKAKIYLTCQSLKLFLSSGPRFPPSGNSIKGFKA